MCTATKMMLSKERSPWTRSYLWSVRNAWATCEAIFKRSYNVNLALSVLLWNNLAKVPYEQREQICCIQLNDAKALFRKEIDYLCPLCNKWDTTEFANTGHFKQVWSQSQVCCMLAATRSAGQGEILLVCCTCTSVTFPLLRLNFVRGRRGYPIR